MILAGVTTEVCVHTTLREACDRNYQCLTVSDGCASGDARIHQAALDMVTVEGGIFGVLSNTSKVLTGLSSLSGET